MLSRLADIIERPAGEIVISLLLIIGGAVPMKAAERVQDAGLTLLARAMISRHEPKRPEEEKKPNA